MQGVLLNPPEPPSAIGVAPVGGQKHTALFARVNHSRGRFWVQHGEQTVWVAPQVLRRWAQAARRLMEAGAKPGEVVHGNYSPEVRQALANEWAETEGVLAEPRQNQHPAFDLFATVFLIRARPADPAGQAEKD